MSVSSRTIKTSHADIAVSETSGGGVPTLLIHGNSLCKEVFRGQLEGDVGKIHRMIAIDLPGHGASGDAFEPERTYSMPGYADAVVETLRELGVDRSIVYGWSLGGHVAMELMPRFAGLVGVMITGAPPVGTTADEIQAGFKPTSLIGLVGKPEFTKEDIESYVQATCGEAADEGMRRAIARTDGRARSLMFQSLFAGKVSNQRELAVNSKVPIAFVDGAADPLVNLEYVGGLAYRNLWDKHCFVLREVGHAPFMQAPEAFNAIFARFLDDMDKRSVKARSDRSSKTAAA